jgi:hypothetical protein
MERLSKEFLEKLITNKQLSIQQIQTRIEQELKLLAEEAAKGKI